MKNFILFILISLIGSKTIAQEKNSSPKQIQKTYYYSFDNVKDQSDMNDLVADLEGIKDVIKVKLNYKPEREAGQVIVILIEPERTAEGEVFFSPKQIKELIIQHHLTPLKMSVSEVVVSK